jgi:hypothetical protein
MQLISARTPAALPCPTACCAHRCGRPSRAQTCTWLLNWRYGEHQIQVVQAQIGAPIASHDFSTAVRRLGSARCGENHVRTDI